MRGVSSICGMLTLLFVSNAFCGEIARQFQSRSKDIMQVMKGSRTFEQITSEDTGITEIGLERTACFGACPAYAVIIKGEGTFRYKGEQFAKRQGEHVGKISKWELNSLLKFIKDSDYFSMQDEYETSVTDSPTAYTYVVMSGKKKIIRNYTDSGPTKLWAIQQLIDKLLLEAEGNNEK